MSGRTRRIAIAGAAVGMILLMGSLPFLPFPMGIVADAKHVYIDAVPSENRGAYVTTDDGVMQLYTWRVPPTEFPSDAPTFRPDRIRSLDVVLKVYDPPENYRLYEFDTSHEVAWVEASESEDALTLVPPRLDEARYMLVVPTDSMYGGTTRHYFSVAG